MVDKLPRQQGQMEGRVVDREVLDLDLSLARWDPTSKSIQLGNIQYKLLLCIHALDIRC